MKNRANRIRTFVAAVGGLIWTSPALAAPILIDFTDASWSGASGETSYSQSYGALDVTLSADGGLLSFDTDAPGSAGSLTLDGDGIGIGDDEIGRAGDEVLNVSFNSAVTIRGYYFLDLFGNEGPEGEGEQTLVELSGGGSFNDLGSANDGVGYYAREDLDIGGTQWIDFSAAVTDGYPGTASWFSDFAVAGILVDYDGVEVPEPGAFGILGLGLLGLGLAGRRRRRA